MYTSVDYRITYGLGVEDEAILRDGEVCFRLIIEGAREFAMILFDASGRNKRWNSGAEPMVHKDQDHPP